MYFLIHYCTEIHELALNKIAQVSRQVEPRYFTGLGFYLPFKDQDQVI